MNFASTRKLKIKRYCSAIGIRLDEKLLDKLYPAYVSTIPDLYYLKHKRTDTDVKQLLDDIEESRITTLDKFLFALRITNESKSKLISEALNGDINEFILRARNRFDWNKIAGIGESSSRTINDSFKEDKETILELLKYIYIKPHFEESDNFFEGKIFSLSGVLNDRLNTTRKIKARGGVIVKFVNSKVDYIVTNNSYEFEDKIKIISEKEISERCLKKEGNLC